MQFTTAILLFASSIAASALPGQTVRLSDGSRTVEAQLVDRALEKREFTDCKGSGLCSNSQSFKDQCTAAFNSIEYAGTYSAGGAGSGVCSGNCGLFIQGTNSVGTGCTINGNDLADGYNKIRQGGCQTCGSLHRDGYNEGCLVTINYVTGC